MNNTDILNQLIDSCDIKLCSDYAACINSLLNNHDAKLASHTELFRLFSDVTGYQLIADAPDAVFTPMIILDGKRSAIPDDLTHEQKKILFDSLEKLLDPEIKARICDVLWQSRFEGKSFQLATSAIKFYLESATNLPSNSFASMQRYERALILFMKIGQNKKDNLLPELNAINKIEIAIAKLQEEQNLLQAARLIRILHKYTKLDTTIYLDFINKSAIAFETNLDFITSIEFWKAAVEISKDKNSNSYYKIKYANTYFQRALIEATRETPSAMKICSLLEEAINAYRFAPGTSNLQKDAYKLHQEWKPKISSEMKSHPYEFDCSEEANKVVNFITGKNKATSLMCFAYISEPLSIKYVQTTMNANRGSILASLFKQYHFDEKFINVDVSSKEDTQHDICYRYVKNYLLRKINLVCRVRPAWITMRNEHSFTFGEIWDLVQYSTFVPQDRIDIFTKGLYYGFAGEFITFAHLIIPQLENSFRHVLNKLGIDSSKMLDGGIQENKGLDWSLIEHADQLGSIIGDDIVFDMRGMLIAKSGSNLRHNALHGLCSSGIMYEDCEYLFWLVIRILFNVIKLVDESLASK